MFNTALDIFPLFRFIYLSIEKDIDVNIIKEKHLREDIIKILKTTFGSVGWGAALKR